MAEILINFDDALIQFTAVGGETGFAYDFPIFDKVHLVVLRQATASSAPVTMLEGTGYTVTGVGVEAGGTIVFVTPANATAGEVYTLLRDVPEVTPSITRGLSSPLAPILMPWCAPRARKTAL